MRQRSVRGNGSCGWQGVTMICASTTNAPAGDNLRGPMTRSGPAAGVWRAVSTGDGASLEFIQRETPPGLAALSQT